MQDKLGDRSRLLHIIDAIEEIKQYIEGTTFEDFVSHSMMKNASIRQLGIIGEACNRLSEELKENYNDVEWRNIIGLRNIIIHQYFGVDDKVIWDILQGDLPELEEQVKLILSNLSD